MRILGVLDIMRGEVVRGIGGRRAQYRPIQSRLTSSCLPLDVAEAFRERFGLTELYLADLDAIAGEAPALPIYSELQDRGFQLWVDAGLRTGVGAKPLADAGVTKIVAGLETLTGPDALRELCRDYGPDRIAFSLDLRGGQPLGDRFAWDHGAADAIAARALGIGIRSVILLDLTRVGTGAGTGTEGLLARLARSFPEAEWLAGGGVRKLQDVQHLLACGAAGVLVASALHDGGLTRADVASL